MVNELQNYSKDQLLAMLPNNVAPAEPSVWALSAVGVAIASVIAISLLAGLIFLCIRYRKNRYRKQFLKRIQQCSSITEINEQLKLLCFKIYGRPRIASLTSLSWLECLDAHHTEIDWLVFNDRFDLALYGGESTIDDEFKRCAILFARDHKSRWAL